MYCFWIICHQKCIIKQNLESLWLRKRAYSYIRASQKKVIIFLASKPLKIGKNGKIPRKLGKLVMWILNYTWLHYPIWFVFLWLYKQSAQKLGRETETPTEVASMGRRLVFALRIRYSASSSPLEVKSCPFYSKNPYLQTLTREKMTRLKWEKFF